MSREILDTASQLRTIQPLDETVDHLRGPAAGPVMEHGDYECPYDQFWNALAGRT
jgi:hypothetical protein